MFTCMRLVAALAIAFGIALGSVLLHQRSTSFAECGNPVCPLRRNLGS